MAGESKYMEYITKFREMDSKERSDTALGIAVSISAMADISGWRAPSMQQAVAMIASLQEELESIRDNLAATEEQRDTPRLANTRMRQLWRAHADMGNLKIVLQEISLEGPPPIIEPLGIIEPGPDVPEVREEDPELEPLEGM